MYRKTVPILILLSLCFFVNCYASPVFDSTCNPASDFDANLPSPITKCRNNSIFQLLQSLLLVGLPRDSSIPVIQLTQSGGTTNVSELGGTDTYTIALTSEPKDSVSIEILEGSQLLVNGLSSTTLTFDLNCPGDTCWSILRTVTVSAVDDELQEGNHSQTIAHTVSSNDSRYNLYAIPQITVNIQDNDSAGVTITESGGSTSVTEAGGTDTYTVVLTSQPTNTVIVTVTADAQTRVNGGATVILTFTTGNWNTTQTVTVSAVDDAIAEGTHNGTITHSSSSSDTNYNSIGISSVTASISDNDSAGVTITESGGSTSVTEAGGTDTYTVVLTSQPTNTVTVTVTADAQTRVNSGATATLTFTTGNWNTTQTVTVSAVNDAIAEGTHNGTITHSSSSSDTNYNSIGIASVTTSISDNDSAGVTITESGGSTSVTEAGGTDTYTVVLTSQPTNTVTVTVTADAQTRVNSGATATLTFTTGNWNTTQTVTVSAVNDAMAEGTHNGTITHSSSSSDANYNSIGISSVTASISDNDSAGVTITESGGSTSVTEAGGTDTYTVVLTSQPTNTVTVTVTADAQTRVNGGATATLTFTTGNWNSTQTVTVSAVNDAIAEGTHNGTITHSSSSSDANYNSIGISSVTASISDNDSAGVTITESGGSTSVTEAGGTDTYTVVLTSQPTNTVTVTVTADAQTRVNSGATATLTFTTGNWNSTQTVTVSAVDDDTTEGNHSGSISHSATSSDAMYSGISISSLTVSIVENDFLSSSVPSNNAINIPPCSGNPCRGSIVLRFDQSMNSSLTPTLVTEVADSATPTYVEVPNSNTTFMWTSNSFANDTLTINISWYWFPSNSLIRYTLNNLQSAASINSSQIQQIFTTTGLSQGFGVPDNGNTSCSNMTTTEACSDTGTWPRQDAFFVNTPSAPSYTGPTTHGTFTTDRRTIDNVTGIVWKTCVEGETGASCTGTANTYTWENALDACSALNIANSGVGYWGLTTWRLATSKELDTLPRMGTAGTPNTTAFPGSPATFGWTNMGFLSNRSQAWTTFFVNYQNSASQGKSSLNHVRCVASPASVNATSYTDLGDGTISDNRSNLIWQKCSNGQGNITTTCSGAATSSTWDVNLQYCRNLTLAGRSWRMPSILELRSILDRSLSNRVFDPVYFPNSSPGQYPSSSTWIGQRDSKFMVQISDGNSYANPKTANGPIRCVSTGP